MQSDPLSGSRDDQNDLYTVTVADHGIDPTPIPPASAGRPARRTDRDDERFGWRDTLIWCGIPIVIVLLIRIFLLGFYSIPSGSMMDTIEIGDHVITEKLPHSMVPLKRGDVIVFRDPAHWLDDEGGGFGGDYLIKRLIGLPGDLVECDGAGQPVRINGVAVNETAYIKSGVAPSNFAFRVRVSAGHVFVMGDNRSNSADSRYHQNDGSNGLVPVSDVVGIGLVTYWPLDRIGRLDSHHEVFRDVPDASK
ncbi:MAG: signal peptidase I [Bifidobacterium sp.]|jgi:signal peptidase I|nr:signal peptidase I [Bifidobacterium sp.]MCI1865234.1 signal peptidase I [Bifidobacterium sp.]